MLVLYDGSLTDNKVPAFPYLFSSLISKTCSHVKDTSIATFASECSKSIFRSSSFVNFFDESTDLILVLFLRLELHDPGATLPLICRIWMTHYNAFIAKLYHLIEGP